jgi:tetratricopeptide (TPR) repeat protein
MPDDSIHRNLVPKDDVHSNGENSGKKSGENSGEELNYKVDQAAMRYSKEADDAEAKYKKSKSDTDKYFCIEKQLAAANYLMFEADMNPKDKYKPALTRYRRVLELDPNNQEAMVNKSQIEDIYKSMGKPIPN